MDGGPQNWWEDAPLVPTGGGMTPLPSPPEKPDKPEKPNPGVGYRMKPDGSAEPIPGSEADATDQLTPQSIAFYAQQVLSGAPMPAVGMGKAAAVNRQKIMNEVARQAGAGNLTGADLARQIAHYKAGSGQVAQLEKMLGTVAQSEETARLNGQQFIDRSAELPWQSEIPIINSVVQGAQRNLPVPGHNTISAMDAAWQTFTNEYAKVISSSPSGAGTLSDSARHEAQATMQSNASLSQKKAAFEQMKVDMANRLAAIRHGINDAYTGLTEKPGYVVPESLAAIPLAGHGANDQQNPAAVAGAAAAGGTGGGTPPNGTPPAGNNPPGGTPPVLSPPDPQMAAATDGTKRTLDPAVSAQIGDMVRNGTPLAEINKSLTDKGFEPVPAEAYQAWHKFLADHPDYKGNVAQAWRTAPLSGFEKVVTTVGDNPVGAYLVNAGQFLSGNTLDNMAADPARARASMDVVSNEHPIASTIGGISGGVMAGMLGEAGLARAGMAPGMLRGTVADMMMGGANGAGAADNGSRVAGGVGGALTAGAGSVTGSLASKAAGRILSPTGGGMSDLYAAGVRPTLGQRVADVNGGRGFTGNAGKAINGIEEGLQSIPIVGAGIRGARQEARDQMQVGAFNDALAEVGEQLPKGMRPGTEPHAYAQKVFNQVYDKARSGMRLVGDEELSHDLGNISEQIGLLAEPSQKRFNAMFQNLVARRVQNGELAGPEYKAAVSDLGKQIRLLRNNPNGDHELANALQDLEGALDSAARRHSDPAAVSLLDAADAGYAKYVRLEGASARRGGPAGTFSPAQLDAEVQKASGGIRSKAYNRGDALMQDYAQQARSLEDRMPNSGTADRAMLGKVATGGLATATATGSVSPVFVGFLGAVGAGYAPGVRKVMQTALAPGGPKAQAIRAQLEKRAQLVGRTIGATAAVRALGTSPSP